MYLVRPFINVASLIELALHLSRTTAMDNGVQALETAPLVAVPCKKPSPDTLTSMCLSSGPLICLNSLVELVKRLRALTLTLLPVEVDPQSIKEPTGSVITPQVISAYIAAAGDFVDAVGGTLSIMLGPNVSFFGYKLPYCLIRARVEFMWDANNNPADYGENYGRGTMQHFQSLNLIHVGPSQPLPAKSWREELFIYRHQNACL